MSTITAPEPTLAPARLLPAVLVTGVLAVGAAAAVLATTTGDDHAARTQPANAVAAERTARQFVIAAAVRDAGRVACSYLTAGQQAAVATAGGPGFTCREALDVGSRPGLPATSRAIWHDHATVDMTGGQAQVVLGTGRSALRFTLARAAAQDTSGYLAPTAAWRIAGGAAGVVSG